MRVGLIGCGNIARHHLTRVLEHTDKQNISIADINFEKAENFKKLFGLKNVYSDLKTLIDDQKPEVIHVLTPPALHAEMAINAMESGSNVLIEKPMSVYPEDADEMIRVSEKNKVKLCLNHNFLLDPAIIKATELINKGTIGKIIHVETNFSFDFKRLKNFNDNGLPHWSLNLQGGLLADLLPHPLSVLLHFMNEPEELWAVKKNHEILPYNLPDELRVLFDAGDSTGALSVSLGIKPDSFTVNIYGTEMSVHVNPTNMIFLVKKNYRSAQKFSRIINNCLQAMQILSGTVAGVFKIAAGRRYPPGDVGPLISSFYESLKNKTDVPVNGISGKKVVKYAGKIWESVTDSNNKKEITY